MSSNREVILLKEKTEDLIVRAVNEGAAVDFLDVRAAMRIGEKYGVHEQFDTANAYLEYGIAVARREREKRSFRKPLIIHFMIKIKNLIGFG